MSDSIGGEGALRPFEQLAYDDVPAEPRLPHPYFAAEASTVRIASTPFGEVDVHVKTFGSGPPLVCVHGLMTSSYSFRYVLEPLGRHFTVIVPDLIGAGASSKPDASYHPDAVADSLGEILAAVGARGAPMIGNSLGGYLAMRLALRDPGAIGRLVCLHAPGLPTGRMRALRIALDVVPGVRRLVDALIRRDPRRWVHKNVHYIDESLKSREEHEEYARPLSTPEGRRAFTRILDETLDVREMVAFERGLRARAGTFPVPLLLVYVERDPMVPPEIGDRLAALLPTAGFTRLAEGSHFAHVDAPEAFLEAALPFLLT